MKSSTAPPLHVIVLAAGRGTRMRSRLPKVMQPLAGRPMLAHVLDAVAQLQPEVTHLVHAARADALQQAFADYDLHWVEQSQQSGTGHAVQQVLPSLPTESQVLIVMGDQPLLTAATLRTLIEAASDSQPCVLTLELSDPTGYGRIVRDRRHQFSRIVEQADADSSQLQITEVNSGIYCLPAAGLQRWLENITADNAAGELYLTDVLAGAVADGIPVNLVPAQDPQELQGANTQQQLAQLERCLQRRRADALLAAGVRLADPERIDIRGTLACGSDVAIDINCVFTGNCELGDDVSIGPGCVLTDSSLAAGTRVAAHSVLEGVITEGACSIGPFARLRPGTVLQAGVKIGNFVETKQASIGADTKASHLSYLGNAQIGSGVNIGAGTITCNYDGVNKHTTVIGDGVFIGSDTQLVAPVSIGSHAYIGAGSTIVKAAPEARLTLSRSRQKTIAGWKPPGGSRSSAGSQSDDDGETG